MSLSNSYSLDKNLIFDSLIQKNINKISEYLSTIDSEILSIKDQQLYNYLIAKIYIEEKKFNKAKSYLLLSINSSKNLKNNKIPYGSINNLYTQNYLEIINTKINLMIFAI